MVESDSRGAFGRMLDRVGHCEINNYENRVTSLSASPGHAEDLLASTERSHLASRPAEIDSSLPAARVTSSSPSRR